MEKCPVKRKTINSKHGSASTRAARAVSSLERLALGFERQTGIHPEATDRSRKSDAKDVQIVVEIVLKARILEVIDKRCQSKFPNSWPAIADMNYLNSIIEHGVYG